MDNVNVKNFANTYLYRKTDMYEKKLIEFIMKSDRIDKSDKSFEDIKLQVKRRQVTNILYTVLEDSNVVLLYGNTPMPKAFKVFCVKDIKVDNRLKVFIDCSSILRKVNGAWETPAIDVLIAHLLSAMTNYIYYAEPNRIILNNDIAVYGARAFSSLFTNIINYLYKINLLEAKRDKCKYLASMYYLVNILDRDVNSNSCMSISKRVSDLSDREIELLHIGLDKDSFTDIKTFIDTVSKLLKIDKLTLDSFMEKWIFLYGTGTHFGTEYFPEFSAMLTDTYVGCYINNQKTIEKITGTDMVNFTKVIFRLGEVVMK